MKCPKCGSVQVKIVDVRGAKGISCEECGFDEFEVYPGGRSSQKAKGRFSPYKRGGGQRTRR